MEDQAPNRDHARGKIHDAVEMTKKRKYADAIDVFEEYLPALSEGDIQDKRMAASSFSYYGVCVAMVKRKYAEAVKYCNISLKSNFMEPEHRINLAQVYLERDDRAKAVENLEAARRLQPSNKRVKVLYREIGTRHRPTISFLPRGNPLNVWLGKMRASKTD